MKIKLSFKKKTDYLYVKASGKWVKNEIISCIEAIKDTAKQYNLTKIFIDWRDITAHEDETTRYFTGEQIAKIWGWSYKVAALAKPEKIDKFTENVAVNRGANLAVFSKKSAAFKWLIGK